MLQKFYNIEQPLSAAAIITALALMMFTGYLMTRITRHLHLPDVTAYLTAGMLLGPFGLDWIPPAIISGTVFLPDLALAFIAFCTGEFFHFESLKRNGLRVLVITLFEAGLSSMIIFLCCRNLMHLSLGISLVLSALAAVTAPTSTMMIIRQTGAHGEFVEHLLQVVAVDDVIGLLEFSIALSIAMAVPDGAGNFNFHNILRPIVVNGCVVLLGCFFGLLMKWLLPKNCFKDNRLIISIALLLSFCGLCAFLEVSPLLGCMSMGMIYANISEDDKLFKQLNYFSPPLLLLFFVRSGIAFRLDVLNSTSSSIGDIALWIVAVTYFFMRIIGKYGGAWLGSKLCCASADIRKYLGLALIPQAGVTIGLAAMGARMLGGENGQSMETLVLIAGILYELIGPLCTKLALHLSHAIPENLEEVAVVPILHSDGTPKNSVELLVERIQKIRSELPAEYGELEADEAAFTEAAEEHIAQRPNFYFRHLYRRF